MIKQNPGVCRFMKLVRGRMRLQTQSASRIWPPNTIPRYFFKLVILGLDILLSDSKAPTFISMGVT